MIRQYNKLIVLLLIIFWLVLDFSYRYSITEYFSYDGFDYNFDLFNFYLFLVAGAVILVLVRKAEGVLLHQATIISVILIFIPNGILFYSMNGNYALLLCSFLWVSLPIFLKSDGPTFRLLPTFKLVDLPKGLLITSCILSIPFLLTFGIPTSINSIFLQDIYDVRALAVEDSNVLTSYLNSPLAKVLIPTTIIISIIGQRWKVMAFAIILQLYFFLINPHKSVLAFLILALFFSLFNNPKRQLIYFILSMSCIVLIGSYTLINFDFPFIESYISRRSFFVPSLLTNAYFDVFKDEKLYLSYSKINPFLDYPYEMNPTHYVALKYFGKDYGANSGIIGSGYMNFGYLGVFGNILAYSFCISYLNRLKFSFKFFGLILILIITLNSSSLLTSLFTHGMLVMIILINELFKNLDKNEL